jgi:[1-hydroxy-2-(trimethylamino)ethyl]phosphonate dioxygenase
MTTNSVDLILEMFAKRGDSNYGGEAVTQRQHALQAAHFAEKTGADAALITAAFLHDVGHLLHDLPEDAPDHGIDDTHETLAAKWLDGRFPPTVVAPVQLHVEAKRYLCTTDPNYLKHLSAPSMQSLQLQGGLMSEEELATFRSHPHFEAAVRLRRWDEAAKDPHLQTAPIEHYATYIRQVALD